MKLLYFPGCPNVAEARAALREALVRLGLPVQWEEVDITAAGAADLAGFGSPTILINGVDLEPSPSCPGLSCRIYRTGMGAPSSDEIIQALLHHRT